MPSRSPKSSIEMVTLRSLGTSKASIVLDPFGEPSSQNTHHERIETSQLGDNTESGCIVTPRLMLQLAFRAHDLSLALRSSK